MLPFLYPKTKHSRTQSPPKWRDYRRYKSVLRTEFNHKCVYCCRPDNLNEAYFGVDHYKPKNLFTELRCEYSNLFYSCNGCNSRKGEYWPDEDQSAQGLFIPNPCEHVMFDHSRFNGITVEARSKTGKWARDALDLNDDQTVQFRQNVCTIIRALEHDMRRYSDTLARIDRLLATDPGNSELNELRESHQQRLEEIERNLNGYRR